MNQKLTTLLVILLVILFVNILFLNYTVFFAKKVPEESPLPLYNVVSTASDSAKADPLNQKVIVDSCSPYSCVDLIRQATASLTPKTAVTTSSNKSSTTTTSSGSAKEFYVSFGSGQTMSDQWQDIAGLEVYIDSTKYSKIKTVTFEASLRIPTANGRVYAQLFNATDKHPVWFSEISAEGNTSQLVISAPITLDSGNKLYKVQMKTTLKYQSILDQARVHIITQ